MLAASCDALRAVTVWAVPRGQLLFRFTANEAAVLPLRFSGEHTLVYAEERPAAVHIVDLRWGWCPVRSD
jgi:hypothetical protein